MNYLEYRDYLIHYGVKGMKWGVRRTPRQLGHTPVKDTKSLKKQVRKAHTLVNDAERHQGRADAALQASKGHSLLANKAHNSGDKMGEQRHTNKSKKLLKESETYERLAEKTVSDFLKTKASALHGSGKIENGKQYVDSLAGLNINLNNMHKYEEQFGRNSRYSEGYNAESQHVKGLIRKYS